MLSKKSIQLLNILALCSVADASNLRKRSSDIPPRSLASCADSESSWTLALTVDDYPWETRWTIKDLSGNKVAYGPPDDVNYEKRGDYDAEGCLPAGNYIFTVKDRSGDGLCCSFGDGKYEFKVEDTVLAASDDSAFKKLEYPFTVHGETAASIIPGETGLSTETGETTSENKEPTTPIPSKKPTPTPSLSPSVVGELLT